MSTAHSSKTEPVRKLSTYLQRGKRPLANVLMYALAIIIALTVIFPVFWTFRTAAIPRGNMFTDMGLIPSEFTDVNYMRILAGSAVPLTMWNTLKVAVFTILVTLTFSSLAAFRFSRGSFPGKKALFYLFLGTMMIPGLANLVPLYVLMRRLHLMDTHLALVLLISGGSMPMTILILKSFVDTIPRELDDSAFMDGCSKIQVYRHIMLPLLTTGLASCSIITLINVWGQFLVPMTFITSAHKRLVMPAINSFIERHGTDWSLIMAACGISILPVVVIFVFLQRYFIEGMTQGAVKY
jgi:multiple sugar transport system permease protein